jgi:nucleoid-associated protein YgaU
MFGKSFDESVNEAVEKVRDSFPQARVSASVNDKVVTLTGEAPTLEVKSQIMQAFNGMVATENTINQISIPKQAAGFQPAPLGQTHASEIGARVHEVVKGDTLSAIAEKYYGSASSYKRIFEANRSILSDPDKIKVGQKLTIP